MSLQLQCRVSDQGPYSSAIMTVPRYDVASVHYRWETRATNALAVNRGYRTGDTNTLILALCEQPSTPVLCFYHCHFRNIIGDASSILHNEFTMTTIRQLSKYFRKN